MLNSIGLMLVITRLNKIIDDDLKRIEKYKKVLNILSN